MMLSNNTTKTERALEMALQLHMHCSQVATSVQYEYAGRPSDEEVLKTAAAFKAFLDTEPVNDADTLVAVKEMLSKVPGVSNE